MTSRERVLAAIDHREADMVPIDLGAMRSTGIQAIAYGRLKKYLGITSGATRVYDLVQQLAQPEDDLLKLFEVDVVDLGRAFLDGESDWKDWTLPDGSPAKVPYYFNADPCDGGWIVRAEDGEPIARMARGTTYFSQACWPLAALSPEDWRDVGEKMARVSWGGIPSPPYHLPLTEENLAEMRRRAKRLYETTDYAIMVAFGGNLLEWGEYLRRIDNFLTDLIEHRPFVERLLDDVTEIHLRNLEKVLGAVGDYVQIIQMGDDLGTQTGPIISPRMYRELFKERHAAIWKRSKELSDARIFLHSCGSVARLIPDLLEAGMEILNPVQTSAVEMDPATLKREFGRDLTFWGGGCDTQRVLGHGTPTEVEANVRESLRTFAPGGGYVFCQIHNILAEVPPENIAAMFDAAKRYRKYPVG